MSHPSIVFFTKSGQQLQFKWVQTIGKLLSSLKIAFLKFIFFILDFFKISFPISEGSLGEITTIKNYGGSKNDVFQSVVKSADGGYAVLGYTQSNDFDITDKTNESFDFWILKFF